MRTPWRRAGTACMPAFPGRSPPTWSSRWTGPKVVQIRGCSPAQFDAHLADLLGRLIGSREDIPARSGSGSPR
jgi:hypothetical protein